MINNIPEDNNYEENNINKNNNKNNNLSPENIIDGKIALNRKKWRFEYIILFEKVLNFKNENIQINYIKKEKKSYFFFTMNLKKNSMKNLLN